MATIPPVQDPEMPRTLTADDLDQARWQDKASQSPPVKCRVRGHQLRYSRPFPCGPWSQVQIVLQTILTPPAAGTRQGTSVTVLSATMDE